MSRPIAAAIGLCLIAGASGCFLTDPLHTSQRERLDDARARWTALGIRSYEYTYQRQGELLPEAAGPARIVVTSGEIDTVTLTFGGVPILDAFMTIDELFSRLDTLLAEGPDRFTAEYDHTYGFPVRVNADPDIDGADDEFTIQITDFAPRT